MTGLQAGALADQLSLEGEELGSNILYSSDQKTGEDTRAYSSSTPIGEVSLPRAWPLLAPAPRQGGPMGGPGRPRTRATGLAVGDGGHIRDGRRS